MSLLTCGACGHSWPDHSGASCLACLARGREKSDGTLSPDPKYFESQSRWWPRQSNAGALGEYRARLQRAKRNAPPPTPHPALRARDCCVCGLAFIRPRADRHRVCNNCTLTRVNRWRVKKRAERRAGGFCTECDCTPQEGYSLCETHRAKAQRAGARGRDAARDEQRRRRQGRISVGQCVVCESTPVAGRQLCADCLSDKRSRHARDVARWAAGGLCVVCGKARERPDRRLCKRCVARSARAQEKYLESGYCRCGRFRKRGFCQCSRCIARSRAARRRRARRLVV